LTAFEIIDRKIIDLRPSDRNARTHSKKQISEFAASIREFGRTNPILIVEHDVIIAEHYRYSAAQDLNGKGAILSEQAAKQNRAKWY